MNRSIARFTATAVLAVALALAACRTTVPETGRDQINFLPPPKEAALGISEFQKIKDSKKISNNASYNSQVQRVGARLSKVMPVPEAEWEFVVFEDETPNAFALPGGKVGVHTGLFQVTQDEAGLAAVIGHEVAHVVARHSGERLSRGMVTGAAVAGAGALMNRNGEDNKLLTTALGAGALLNTQAHSRKQELEADQIGTLYMARAGYDPREAVELWKRFAAWRVKNEQGRSMPSFLSSHPLDETRIAELQRYLPTALAEYEGA